MNILIGITLALSAVLVGLAFGVLLIGAIIRAAIGRGLGW